MPLIHTPVLFIALAIALTGCGSIQRGYESALLLGDVRAGSGDSRLKSVTGVPIRSTITYTFSDRKHVADVYEPTGRQPRGTLVLIHGFTGHGRRDLRLVEFAASLARSGFVVVAPDVEGPRTFAVGLDDARDIGDTLRHVTTNAGGFTVPPVGLMAFSFAVGPAMIAATDPAVADDVHFLVAIGGYYDLVDTITYVTTGFDPLSDRADTVPEPRREGKWLVLLGQLDRIHSDQDRRRLRWIAESRLDDPDARVDAAVAALGHEGRSVYRLVTNTDAYRVDEYVRGLPVDVRANLEGLDLARRDLSRLQAELILVHGTDDDVIPIGHSERLRDAVGDDQAHLFPASGLHHVEVSPGLRDGWQIWRAGSLILRLADDHEGPAVSR
ncbi:MAG: alpha/beta hydrolase [Gammaproteobacteria bacterium]|nr:alpha/beta hydrolase [Gammaproteobacteria bacterium]